ncbi:MAG: dihydropteroate synthase [Planctomycetes bacterium]|nr:dihydropteroate synthase [Planctomycetota bacterium]
MGIVNVTPDSFSDGGKHSTTDAAVAHALKLAEDGADILDVGGESTRPGSVPVTKSVELARVIPVIEKLRARGVKTAISVDTSKAEVAKAALSAGATIVNDVTAGAGDRDMFDVCARRRATLILMHMKGSPQSMQKNASYDDVVAEVGAHLHARANAAIKAGIKRDKIWIDPGFGFGKRPEDNLQLVRKLPELVRLGYPLVLGVSRKSTLGKLTGSDVNDREPESLAAGLIGALKGAAVLRVHEVGWMKRALTVLRAMW